MNRQVLSLFFLLGIFLSGNLKSQTRSFENYKQNNGVVEVKVTDGSYFLTAFSDKKINTKFIPNANKPNNFSFAIDTNLKAIDLKVSESDNNLWVKTSGISIKINKEPFTIEYLYQNKTITKEINGYIKTDSTIQIKLSVTNDEILYGGGARVLGMNRRGNKLELYNRAHYGYQTHSALMNYTLPIYISSNKYAVLFDNASKGWLDLDSQNKNVITYEAVNGTINYNIVIGEDWFDLTNQYTKLTGRQPLPPRWAFGNFSSRFGYHSQKETEETINKFKEDSIPVDAVIIDIYWFGKGVFGHMGNLDWYADSFPNPTEMIENLKNKGVKTILVTEPFVLTTSNRWQEAVNSNVLCVDTIGNPYTYDFFFGNTGLIDLYKPEAKNWFWNIYKNLTKQGIAGWWGDLGEPEVHPKDLQHAIGSADDIHNAYGHEWAKLVYEGFQKDFSDTRPFILMRAGYAGSQRYGLIPWTGDVSRSWGGLIPQTEISLQMGMQGLAYMHSDLGGFAGGDSIDNELYIRWLQYGVFQPIYRPHAQEEIPAEPVFHNDTTKQHAKNSIDLRYKLLPYNYNMAYENSISGKPLMIPLFFNESDDAELLTYDESYMWGDAFLVSPIKERGKKIQKVYLPKGSDWIDFNTNKQFTGGSFIEIPLSIDYIPVFIKAGSFIPMIDQIYSTEEYSLENFNMNFYFAKNVNSSEYKLYNDDGITPTIKNKNAENFTFSSHNSDGKLAISIEKSTIGTGITKENSINFTIHNFSQKPKFVKVNGEKAEWTTESNELYFNILINKENKKQNIEISF